MLKLNCNLHTNKVLKIQMLCKNVSDDCASMLVMTVQLANNSFAHNKIKYSQCV